MNKSILSLLIALSACTTATEVTPPASQDACEIDAVLFDRRTDNLCDVEITASDPRGLNLEIQLAASDGTVTQHAVTPSGETTTFSAVACDVGYVESAQAIGVAPGCSTRTGAPQP